MADSKKFGLKGLILIILNLFILLNIFYIQPVNAAKEPHKYQIRVDLTENLVFIDEWNADKQAYVATEHVFLCSPGRPATPTPTGTFTAKPRAIDWQYDAAGTGEWERFRSWGHCYVNGTTTIVGAVVFHSPPSSQPNYDSASQREIDLMGSPASHGCVRIWPRQSAWIRANCDGATVKIYYGAGYSDELWYLREDLKQEAPPKEMWPNTVITDKTKYIYTYFGDTLESLSELSGVTVEKLIELNPGMALKGKNIKVGLAVKIK